MIPRISGLFAAIGAAALLFSPSEAQHFRRMDDRQAIELTLDLLRKGIQREDTAKIAGVLAPRAAVGEKSSETSQEILTSMQTIFARASGVDSAWVPESSSGRDPMEGSDFWDFDIVDPVIEIRGDSAVVSCDLVLWGMPSRQGDPVSARTGPTQITLVVRERGQGLPMMDGDFRLRESREGTGSVPRSWQIVGLGGVIDLLSVRSSEVRDDIRE